MASSGAAERRQAFRARRTQVYIRSVVQRTLATRVVARDVNTKYYYYYYFPGPVRPDESPLRYCTPRRPRRWCIGRTALPKSGRQHAIGASSRRAPHERSDQQLNVISTTQVAASTRPSGY